jgi:isopentenyldiphosphate isomerase
MDILGLVSKEDLVVGSAKRGEIHQLGLLHREVHVWFFDTNHNVFFQRSGDRSSSPGCLDATVGGHPDNGEDYLEAAIRETKEETGISVSAADLVLINKFRERTESKQKGTINNFWRSVYIYKNPISETDIKDGGENDGFMKLSLEYLKNLKESDLLLFHRRVPSHELPFVIKYIEGL